MIITVFFPSEIPAKNKQIDTKRNDTAWKDECKIDDCIIKIHAVSKSEMLPEDDSGVLIIQDSTATKVIQRLLTPFVELVEATHFYVISALSDKENCASELPVFKIGKG